MTGWSECAYGWMSDFKGYWFHKTLPGCGSGAGFRNGDYRTDVGAYCCQRNPTYKGGYIYSTRGEAEEACLADGFMGLCSKAEIGGYSKCAAGWTSDWKGYWFHTTLQGCGTGTGYRNFPGVPVGAYCCKPVLKAADYANHLVAIHNPLENRYLRTDASYNPVRIRSTMVRAASDPPDLNEWGNTKFTVVDLGWNQIGLHNPASSRFIRATNTPSVYGWSPVVAEDQMPSSWVGERFYLIDCRGGRVCLYNAALNMMAAMQADRNVMGVSHGPWKPSAHWLREVFSFVILPPPTQGAQPVPPGAKPLQGYKQLNEVRCRGIPYTYDPCYGNCDGWPGLSADECWQKCISNDFPSGCDSSMNSSCMAMSVKGGKCHLFNDQCWQLDTDPGTTTRVKKFEANMRFFEGTRCKNNPYTYDPSVNCVGFAGVSAEECKNLCVESAKAPNCPQKQCAAALYREDASLCHLHDACDEMMEPEPGRTATAILEDNRFVNLKGQKCASASYSEACGALNNVGTFVGLTAAACQQKCEGGVLPDGCPASHNRPCRAASYNEVTQACHLHDECDTMTTSANWATVVAMLPVAYRGFTIHNGKRCSTSPYTYDPNVSPMCNGLQNLDEYPCLDACAYLWDVANCPHRVCRASAWYPSSGQCHMYESCDVLVDDPAVRTFKAQATTVTATTTSFSGMDMTPRRRSSDPNRRRRQPTLPCGAGPLGGTPCPSPPPTLMMKNAKAATARLAAAPDYGPYHELATAVPAVILNLTNYSGLVGQRNVSIPNMRHRFGDIEQDLELLFEMFEGFFRVASQSLGKESPSVCLHKSWRHIPACISAATCLLQAAVPTHIPMAYYATIMETFSRFDEVTWPTITQSLSEADSRFHNGPEVLPQSRCDQFTEVGIQNVAHVINITGSLLQLSNGNILDVSSKTLALSVAMRHATHRSHDILDQADRHRHNSSMTHCLQQLEDVWYPICQHLDCDHGNFWDIFMASHKQTTALLQTNAAHNLRMEIRDRVKLEQRMQRFVSEMQDATFVTRFWRQHDARAASRESLQLYAQQGRDAVLKVVETFSISHSEQAHRLFDRDVVQREMEATDDLLETKMQKNHLSDGLSVNRTQTAWIFRMFKCFGQFSIYASTGYYRMIGTNAAFTFGFSAGGFVDFKKLVKGEPLPANPSYMSFSMGFAAGAVSPTYVTGVSVSASVSLGCNFGTSINVGVGAFASGFVQTYIPYLCPFGQTIPPGCVGPTCIGCSQSYGVYFSIICCSVSLPDGAHNCR